MSFAPIDLGATTLDWSRPYLMGVVNTTPDSFSDGGRFLDPAAAIDHARALVASGADIVDIGGESTRPGGAEPVTSAEELDRVIPVIEALAADLGVPISIDTTKSEVARAAVAAGAVIINDISGGGFDPDIIGVAADAGAGTAYVLGHALGGSIAEVHAAEGDSPGYDRVVTELAARLDRLPRALRTRTIADPGLGFGKRPQQNVELCHRAGELAVALGCPVLVGPSRKRFVAAVGGANASVDPWAARDAGTVGAALASISRGAHMVRVHNVTMVKSALDVYRAIILAGDSWARS